jgi:hypothetical protein
MAAQVRNTRKRRYVVTFVCYSLCQLIFLGYFAVAEEAACAYDQKLVELHGGSGEDHALCCYICVLLFVSLVREAGGGALGGY